MTLGDDTRATYVVQVTSLRQIADAARQAGLPIEVIARMLHSARTALKLFHRRATEANDLSRIELRNIVFYDNPFSASADALYARYGTWAAVADAACRPGGNDLGL